MVGITYTLYGDITLGKCDSYDVRHLLDYIKLKSAYGYLLYLKQTEEDCYLSIPIHVSEDGIIISPLQLSNRHFCFKDLTCFDQVMYTTFYNQRFLSYMDTSLPLYEICMLNDKDEIETEEYTRNYFTIPSLAF
jgi:hypothetical protein